MRAIKFILLACGILGLFASIFNIYVEKTFSGNLTGFISSVFLLLIGMRTKLIEKYIAAINSLTSKK